MMKSTKPYWVLYRNDGTIRAVCRNDGMVCSMPDGELFAEFTTNYALNRFIARNNLAEKDEL